MSRVEEVYGCTIFVSHLNSSVAQSNKNHEWQNIRGPRPYEDNTEFLRNREIQEKRLQQYLEKQKEIVNTMENPST